MKTTKTEAHENEDPVLTYAEASVFLNIDIGTLYSLVSQKRIPHSRLGPRFVRFRKSALEEWLNEKNVEIS